MLLYFPLKEYNYKARVLVANMEENGVLHNKDIHQLKKQVVVNLQYLHFQSILYEYLFSNYIHYIHYNNYNNYNNYSFYFNYLTFMMYLLIFHFEDISHSLFYGMDNLVFHVDDLAGEKDIDQIIVYLIQVVVLWN